MNNIILIGMPGCGKTTIGRILSESLKMEFVDTDELLERNYDKKIRDIFEFEGEELFREYETETLNSLKGIENTIISTGGGIIVKDRNIPILKELGMVFFIDREVEDILSTLDSDTRPLLTEDRNRIYDLYDARHDKYRDACDIIISNNQLLEKVVENIISEIKR